MFHCCVFITLKYAHFWHKTRQSLLITDVFLKDFTWCQGLWSSLCRSSTQISPVFLAPPLQLSLFPFVKCLSNFLVWEKTQFNQNFSFCCLSEGEEWGGRDAPREEKVKKGEWWYANPGFLSSRRVQQMRIVCKPQSRKGERRS